MKLRFLIVLFIAGFSSTTFGQDDFIQSFFEKYSDNDQFTSIYVAPKMFSIVKEMNLNMEDEDAEKIMQFTNEFSSLRILVAENPDPGLYDSFASQFSKADYEVLMKVNSKGESDMDFLIKEKNNAITDLLLLVGGEEEDFVLLSFKGNIDLDKVRELAKEIETTDK